MIVMLVIEEMLHHKSLIINRLLAAYLIISFLNFYSGRKYIIQINLTNIWLVRLMKILYIFT